MKLWFFNFQPTLGAPLSSYIPPDTQLTQEPINMSPYVSLKLPDRKLRQLHGWLELRFITEIYIITDWGNSLSLWEGSFEFWTIFSFTIFWHFASFNFRGHANISPSSVSFYWNITFGSTLNPFWSWVVSVVSLLQEQHSIMSFAVPLLKMLTLYRLWRAQFLSNFFAVFWVHQILILLP